MPQSRLKDMSVWSLTIFIVMYLLTALILYIAVNYAIDFWATFYCGGWNESSMQVTSCSISGIENYANNGYGLLLISAFTIELPFFLPALISFLVGGYWFGKRSAWKKDVLYSRALAWIGLSLSAIAFLIFVVVFLLSSTPLLQCSTLWGAPWAPSGCGF
jgi:hypothetical protein